MNFLLSLLGLLKSKIENQKFPVNFPFYVLPGDTVFMGDNRWVAATPESFLSQQDLLRKFPPSISDTE